MYSVKEGGGSHMCFLSGFQSCCLFLSSHDLHDADDGPEVLSRNAELRIPVSEDSLFADQWGNLCSCISKIPNLTSRRH